jgi:hypothetical protein
LLRWDDLNSIALSGLVGLSQYSHALLANLARTLRKFEPEVHFIVGQSGLLETRRAVDGLGEC